MDKNLPIMDKAEEMFLLQYAVTVTETDTQNEMELPVLSLSLVVRRI